MSTTNTTSNKRKKVGIKSTHDNNDFSEDYVALARKFSQSKRPIPVDFRKLVNFHSGIDRFTHIAHFYPAKLLLNIPYFFLRCKSLTGEVKTVLDPFCGSGTVLLEAIINGKAAYGADANPLARKISKVKTTPINCDKIERSTKRILANARKSNNKRLPQAFLNWEHWYSPLAHSNLAKLSHEVGKTRNPTVRNFLELCLSQTARKTSFADPKVSVPVKINPQKHKLKSKLRIEAQKLLDRAQNSDPITVFEKIVKQNAHRLTELSSLKGLGEVLSISDDARKLKEIPKNSIDLIITSPPYAGAQKYIRSSSHGIGWLQLSPDGTLRTLERKNIGREHYSKSEYLTLTLPPVRGTKNLLKRIYDKNPLRAHIAANYLKEMAIALKEAYRVLAKSGTFILVVGNNEVCGETFETQKYIRSICTEIGFSTHLVLRDDINSRGLMTKRNKTASVIACEWIIVLKK